MNYRPVFISGCDSSGTKLLGDILGNTEWTVTTPESQFIHDMVIQFQLGSFQSSLEAACWLSENFLFLNWDLPLTQNQLANLIDLKNPRLTVNNLIGFYAQRADSGKHNADVWVDHTPNSFKHHPILKSLFPEARFIHVVRDGRAVCASIKKLEWGPNNAYKASRYWAGRIEEALGVEVAEGENCLRVHFEDLLRNPSLTLATICKFIDVPFSSNMLGAEHLDVPTPIDKPLNLVRNSLQILPVDDWQKTLSRAELRDFESYPLSHAMLTRMNYKPAYEYIPEISISRILIQNSHEFIHYLYNRYRQRRSELQAVGARHKYNGRQHLNEVDYADYKRISDPEPNCGNGGIKN
ncbi:MAG: hypothetical protein ACI92E_001325 [Oceanicoccus sp.]|jgi:hypothetical protein